MATTIRSRCSLAVAVALLANLVLVVLVRPARADEHRTSSLSWVELPSGGGCGGAPTVARAVEARLGRHAIVSPVDAELSIEAYVERSGRPPIWHAVVNLRGRDGALLGSRELASAADDCDELRASVALVAALMIDPEAALRAPGGNASGSPALSEAPAPSPAPSCPPPPEPPPAPPPRVIIQRVEVAAPVPAASPWTVNPSASFALGVGVLPSTAAGVRLGVTVGLPRPWAFEIFTKVWSAQTVGAVQGAQVRFARIDAGLATCPLTLGSHGLARLTACAAVEVGFLQADPEGFVSPESSLDPTLRLALPATLAFPVGRGFLVDLGGDVGLAVVRSQFVYGSPTSATGVVATQPLVSGEATLGLGIQLH